MGVFDKLKDRIKTDSGAESPTSTQKSSAPGPALPLDPSSIPRYRRQRGVNLGSWFVLERWIADSLFQNAASPGKSDYDVAKGKDAKRVFESHWDSWISEEDWKWIKEHGYNSVRIPVSLERISGTELTTQIGYYHLCSVVPDVLKGTDFEPFHDVFDGAWPRIQRAIDTAESYGLGVLVDLHAAAGAQNADGKPFVCAPKTADF